MHGVTPIELSGEIQMDFKSDRISDFMVYYLSDRTAIYEEYMRIPLTKASSNITDCLPWMVRLVSDFIKILQHSWKYSYSHLSRAVDNLSFCCGYCEHATVEKWSMIADHKYDHKYGGGGQISPFPIDFDRRPYNILALPCECVIYTPWVKKTRHQTLGHNFTNFYPIFKIFSQADSVVNLQQIHVQIFHHALNVSLHYYVKYECRKMASFWNTYCN